MEQCRYQAFYRQATRTPPESWASSSSAFTMPRGSCGACLSYNAFGRSPLSAHAIVPFAFRRPVSAVTQEHSSEFLLPAGGISDGARRRTVIGVGPLGAEAQHAVGRPQLGGDIGEHAVTGLVHGSCLL